MKYLCAIILSWCVVASLHGGVIIRKISSGGGSGDFTYVTSNSNGANPESASIAVTLTGVSAGDTVVVFVKHEAASTTATCSDGTDSLTAATYYSAFSDDLHGRFFYLPSSTASGSVTYTVTFGDSRPYRRIIAWCFTHTGTVTLDTENSSSGTSTSPSSGNMSTYDGATLVFGGYAEYSENTTSSELVNSSEADYYVRASLYTSSWVKEFTSSFTGAATATLGSSQQWLCIGLSIKDVP